MGKQMRRDALLSMTNGFRLSQAIHVAATLGIADLLKNGPRTVGQLSKATGTDGPSLTRMLRALASVGVFTETEGRIGQTPLSDNLRSDASGSLRAWAMQIGQDYFWNSWGHLLDSVRTGNPAFREIYGMTAWEYRAANPEANAIFNAAMTGLSSGVVEALVAAYDFSTTRVLVDVAGGEGALLAAILVANPHLRGILFDLPHVVATARPLLERAGVSDRCDIVSGSFFERVPQGGDAYILKNIVHDWDDASSVSILRRCRAAIDDGGRLLLVEQVLKGANEPDSAKFADLVMLVMLGGRERNAEEFQDLCLSAGFRQTNIIPTVSPYSIIESVAV
jgi:hypothetical protein